MGHMEFTLLPFIIGQKAMQLPDGQRLIHIIAGTNLFAGVMANPATDPRKGVVFFEKFQCFLIFTLVDQGNITLNTDMRRTGGLTGGCPPFFDAKSTGNGLGIFFNCRLTRGKTLVIVIGAGYGTYLGTFTTTGTFV